MRCLQTLLCLLLAATATVQGDEMDDVMTDLDGVDDNYVDYMYEMTAAQDLDDHAAMGQSDLSMQEASHVDDESPDNTATSGDVNDMQASVEEDDARNHEFAAEIADEDTTCPAGATFQDGQCVNVDNEQPQEEECGRRFVQVAGVCISRKECDIGFYRAGDGTGECVEFPSTPTCHAEVEALQKHALAEKAQRKQELAIIKTVRILLDDLEPNNDDVQESASTTTTKVAPKEMLELLQSVTKQQRQEALEQGKDGILHLLNELEGRLKRDGILAERATARLAAHCRTLCHRVVRASQSTYTMWHTKFVQIDKSVAAQRKTIQDDEGTAKIMREDAEKANAAHLKLKQQRKTTVAVIEWLREKIADLDPHPVGNEDDDAAAVDLAIAPIVAGLDENDADLGEVMVALRRKDEIKSIQDLLDRIEAKLNAANEAEKQNIQQMHFKVQALEERLAGLRAKAIAHETTAISVSGKEASAHSEAVRQRGFCAAFGVTSI